MRFVTTTILFKQCLMPYLHINLQATENRRNTIGLIIKKISFLAASGSKMPQNDIKDRK